MALLLSTGKEREPCKFKRVWGCRLCKHLKDGSRRISGDVVTIYCNKESREIVIKEKVAG